MSLDPRLSSAGRRSFRGITVLYWAQAGVAFVLLWVTVAMGAFGVLRLEDYPQSSANVVTAALALVAASEVALIPWLRRRLLTIPPRLGRGEALETPAVAQLQGASMTAISLAFAPAVYGVVVGLLGNGIVAIAFPVLALVALAPLRPHWEDWDRHLRTDRAQA